MSSEIYAATNGKAARTAALVAAALLCAFLSMMAWTGKLVGVDGFKIRLFRWIVEDVGVQLLGRSGATTLFGALSLLTLLLLARSRTPHRGGKQETRDVAVSSAPIKAPAK